MGRKISNRELKISMLEPYKNDNLTFSEISDKIYEEYGIRFTPKQIYHKVRSNKKKLVDFKYTTRNPANNATGLLENLSIIAINIKNDIDRFGTITREDMSKAIFHAFEHMDENDAEKEADYILSHTGYSDLILDNTLSKSERDKFYTLVNIGIMKTCGEETVLPTTGKKWKINYFLYNREGIRKILEEASEQTNELQDNLENLYNHDEMWKEAFAKKTIS